MSYKVTFSKKAKKDISKFRKPQKIKMGMKIKMYAERPFAYAEDMKDKGIGKYRWRIANYRVIFDVSGKTIRILRIRDRKDVYKGH